MKRIFMALLVLVTLLSLTLVATASGDVNADGETDLKDVTTLRRYLAGGYGIDTVDKVEADTNGDGEIDLKDVTTLRRFLAGGYGVELAENHIYVIVGTEKCGTKTYDKDEIVIMPLDGGDNVQVSVYDIGLEYNGNINDLIGLHITINVSDGRMTCNGIRGSFTDGETVTYTRSSFAVGDVTYTADNVKENFLRDIYGAVIDVSIFDGRGNITIAFMQMIPDEHDARVIDYDGDGAADALIVVSKIAYRVDSVKMVDGEKNYILETLDRKSQVTYFDYEVNIPLEKGDVVVTSCFNTMYAEKVERIDTYATNFNAYNMKLTLNGVGDVLFGNVPIDGVPFFNITSHVLYSDNVFGYYVYKDYLLFMDMIQVDVHKSEAVLLEVIYDEGYYAKMSSPYEGRLTLKLSDSEGEELYAKYKADDRFYSRYNYALVTEYIIGADGAYDFSIVDSTEWEDDGWYAVEKGTTISYSADLGMSTIGAYNEIMTDKNTIIYSVKDGRWHDVEYATADFEARTAADSLLRINEDGSVYLALAVVYDLEFIRKDQIDYTKDGSLIVYSYEDSSVCIFNDYRLYNEYCFMDMNTLQMNAPFVNTRLEYDRNTNPGTKEGGLYGYDYKKGIYVQITADMGLGTVLAGSLADVLAYDDLIELKYGSDFIIKRISSDVTIWGLSSSRDNDVITKLSLFELDDMFRMVKDYNKENEAQLEIQTILLMKYDDYGRRAVCSVIVEIFEADEDGIVSVNDTIFDMYYR